MSARRSDEIARRVRDRLVASGFALLTHVLLRIPDRRLHAAAQVAGAGLYLVWPRRRALVRSNLGRVCRWLTAEGLGGPRVARAAGDPRALDRLVRSAFGHYVRSYLEVVLAPGLTSRYVADRIEVETPEAVREAFERSTRDHGLLFIALHFGALELPGLYVTSHGGRPVTAPMETISNDALQAYLERSRSANGVRLVPARGSARALAAALERGESVAIVADRPVVGGGRRVSLFGMPARLPLGPALLALGSGAPTYVAVVRRTGFGTYAGRLVRLEVPAEGSQRERLTTLLARQARVFEMLIADAPDQWWTVFFPIWEDRPTAAADSGEPRTSQPAGPRMRAPVDRRDAASDAVLAR